MAVVNELDVKLGWLALKISWMYYTGGRFPSSRFRMASWGTWRARILAGTSFGTGSEYQPPSWAAACSARTDWVRFPLVRALLCALSVCQFQLYSRSFHPPSSAYFYFSFHILFDYFFFLMYSIAIHLFTFPPPPFYSFFMHCCLSRLNRV